MNFKALFNHFQALYGRNNATYLTSLSQRIDLLLYAVGKLQDSVRKQHPPQKLASGIANTISRTFAVAGHFWQLPLNEAMCVKYPRGGCGYCHKKPCSCLPHERKEHVEAQPEVAQLEWNLREHQQNLADLYLESNREKGIENALNRLFKEVTEISLLVAGLTHSGSSAKELEWEYAKEIADVFAWIIAIAALHDIDAQDATLSVYGKGCPACPTLPCSCPRWVIVGNTIRHSTETCGTRPT